MPEITDQTPEQNRQRLTRWLAYGWIPATLLVSPMYQETFWAPKWFWLTLFAAVALWLGARFSWKTALFLLVWLGAGLVGHVVSGDAWPLREILGLLFALLPAAAVYTTPNDTLRQKLQIAMALAAALQAVTVLVQKIGWFTLLTPPSSRADIVAIQAIGGWFGNPVYSTWLIVLGIPFLLTPPRQKSRLAWFILVLLLTSLALSGERLPLATASALIGWQLFCRFARKATKRRQILGVVCLLIVVGGGIATAGAMRPGGWHKLRTDGLYQSRPYMWSEILRTVAREQPVTGFGMASLGRWFDPLRSRAWAGGKWTNWPGHKNDGFGYMQPWPYAHNMLVEWLWSCGLVLGGGLLLLGLWLARRRLLHWLQKVWRGDDPFALALAALLVGCQSQFLLFVPPFALLGIWFFRFTHDTDPTTVPEPDRPKYPTKIAAVLLLVTAVYGGYKLYDISSFIVNNILVPTQVWQKVGPSFRLPAGYKNRARAVLDNPFVSDSMAPAIAYVALHSPVDTAWGLKILDESLEQGWRASVLRRIARLLPYLCRDPALPLIWNSTAYYAVPRFVGVRGPRQMAQQIDFLLNSRENLTSTERLILSRSAELGSHGLRRNRRADIMHVPLRLWRNAGQQRLRSCDPGNRHLPRGVTKVMPPGLYHESGRSGYPGSARPSESPLRSHKLRSPQK